MGKHNKLNSIIHIRNAFYSEVGIGILANTILFLFHLIKVLFDNRIKKIDMIIGLLALIHLLMLLIMGFIATDSFTSLGGLWDDITCKSVIYLYRFLRGFSISATCLLSVLQAITLSPRSSCLAKFKSISPQDSLRWLLFLWVFYMSFSAHFSISAVANSTVSSQGLVFVSDSCTILPMTYFLRHLFSILGVFRDIFLIGFMVLSSGYMVTLLCRHRRQCQHLQSKSLSPQASPEQRATRTILLLMSFFVLLYSLDCIIFSSRIMWNNDPVCRSIQIMVSNGYATISPLVFICTEKQSVDFLKCLWGRRVNV
ncbi:Vomeronasal type-1 receptor 90 [Sciurus carolinensis]|uniref:Vomeronasal type-1 receptor n=1 Tax=Sciurus carolinensis TaxID=30640 RepID=A0AA41MI22_SCICA|nr:Vomeronasal type-1 receptor 90 [Sciurus carolinensis]MBZ3885797.1 Vomeronasal type-1 receptor 90 [Sciurus carolinensis]